MALFSDVFRQTNAYAMQLGGILGLYWCLGLLCMVAGFQVSFLHSLVPLIVLGAPLLGYFLARYFEGQVRADAPVDFVRAFLFCYLMYLYATVILGGVTYIYFTMFDEGSFIEANIAKLQRPEMKELLSSPQMQSQINEALTTTGFKSLEEMFRSVTPLMLAANIVDLNLLIGVILSIPTAFFIKTKPLRK